MSGVEADRELLERIRSDAPGAFEEFVERWGSRIYAFGVRVCGEREDARDVAQDTLLQAYRALGELNEPRALRSWIFRVVSNACRMRRRKGNYEGARELTLEELMPRDRRDAEIQIPDTGSLPDDDLARKEIQEAVQAGIRELPSHYRMVLLLRDIEQLSTREVGEALDLEDSAVKMRLHRARVMLRNVLADRLGRPATGEATR